MNLFQYWDNDPPRDVLGFMDAVRAEQTAFRYVRHDHRSAGALVAERHGGAVARAWRALRVPAAQADLLRLLLLHDQGGLWVDAGYRLSPDLHAFLHDHGGGLMPMFLGMVANNGFLYVPEAGNSFVRACIDLAVDNVLTRRATSALMATGPGVVNAVRSILPGGEPTRSFIGMNEDWCRWGWDAVCEAARDLIPVTPELVQASEAFTRIDTVSLQPHAWAPPSSHRESDQHWSRWQGDAYWPEDDAGPAPSAEP